MSSESELNSLSAVKQQLAALTGGASARTVLAELARSLASELAQYFDELPMHPFNGLTARSGRLRFVLPNYVRQRVLLGRYLTMTAPAQFNDAMMRSYATIAVLALGADGVLRRGKWSGFVRFSKDRRPPIEPLDWSDILLRNMPNHVLVMRRWTGTADPQDIAAPNLVLDTLTALADRIAADSARDLAQLRKLL